MDQDARIHVRVTGSSDPQSEILDSLVRYWTEQRGALLLERAYVDAFPISLGRKERGGPAPYSDRLAYAVSPEDQGWIAVADSEQYTADFELATHLATDLGTTVCYSKSWENGYADEGDPTRGEDVHWFGTDGTTLAPPVHAFDHAVYTSTDIEGFRHVCFEEISKQTYRPRRVPAKGIILWCEWCDAGYWSARHHSRSSLLEEHDSGHAWRRAGLFPHNDHVPSSGPLVVLEEGCCVGCGTFATWLEVEWHSEGVLDVQVAKLDAETLARADLLAYTCVTQVAETLGVEPWTLSPQQAVEHLRTR